MVGYRISFLRMMVIWSLCIVIVGCSAVTAEDSSTFPDSVIDAEVVKVIDSDTIKVRYDGKQETVRMLLVDGPETVHPEKPVQPFGTEASNLTKKTLGGKMVHLELGVNERDKYGRLLAYVWIENQLFNETLVKMGMARVAYVYQPNVKYLDRLRKDEQLAQEKRIGIWSIKNYVQDDGFHPEKMTKE